MKERKPGSLYRCQQCGFASPKAGTCPDCKRATGELVSLVEERTSPERSSRHAGPRTGPVSLKDVALEPGGRALTRIGELDRVLGGGVVRGSLVLIGGDPGIGKCVTADTRVLDPTSGAYLPITKWARQRRTVLALHEPALRFGATPVIAFHERGTHPIVEVKTKLGRTLRCTLDHPLLTPDGWQPVSDLTSGARIAAPRELPYFGLESQPEPAIKLVAYILSDGSAQSAITVTSALPDVGRDLTEIATAFGMHVVSYEKRGNTARQYRFCNDLTQRTSARQQVALALRGVKNRLDVRWRGWARRAGVSASVLSAWRRGECVPNAAALQHLADAAGVSLTDLAPHSRNLAEAKTPIARFLEGIGVRFLRASEKSVPERFFLLPRDQLALFLRILFTCDGSVYVNRQGRPGISYSTISRRLAEDVQHLLLRFGLVATLRTKVLALNRPYVAYEVVLLGLPQVQRFLARIGITGREAACERVAAMATPRGQSTSRDTVPTGPPFWARVEAARRGLSFAEISRRAGVKFKSRRHDRPLCRATLARVARVLTDPHLRALADGDVYWDAIASVVPAGEAPVYDVTVAESANFVANDLIVHNSTLLLQAARALAEVGPPVLYVSAEESAAQVKLRAERLGVSSDGLLLWAENDLSAIAAALDDVRPRALVVDSIQTVFLPELESAPGSVTQVRECGARLLTIAKGRGIATFVVGHVTKDGALAGPRVLEHLVDTVLYFEGERHHAYRILRAVKNRFGSTNEIGVFQMAEQGLVEVRNPSGFFLAERPIDAPGSVIVASLEGTRPLLLELQALVTQASFGTPRRTVLGADYNRVCLLLAVLEKRAGVPLGTQDVYVNVAGGGRVMEPAADLGIVIAAASSYMDRPVRGDVLVLGEVGLTGEVRAVTGVETRLREGAALGFRQAVVPASNLVDHPKLPLEVQGVSTIDSALDVLLG